MNRRAFLLGSVAAPLAAALPSVSSPDFATGGYVKPGHYIVGERGPEQLTGCNKSFRWLGVDLGKEPARTAYVVVRYS